MAVFYDEQYQKLRSDYCERCGHEWTDCICCKRCEGSGWVPTTPLDGIDHYSLDSDMTKPCPKCGGQGC